MDNLSLFTSLAPPPARWLPIIYINYVLYDFVNGRHGRWWAGYIRDEVIWHKNSYRLTVILAVQTCTSCTSGTETSCKPYVLAIRSNRMWLSMLVAKNVDLLAKKMGSLIHVSLCCGLASRFWLGGGPLILSTCLPQTSRVLLISGEVLDDLFLAHYLLLWMACVSIN